MKPITIRLLYGAVAIGAGIWLLNSGLPGRAMLEPWDVVTHPSDMAPSDDSP